MDQIKSIVNTWNKYIISAGKRNSTSDNTFMLLDTRLLTEQQIEMSGSVSVLVPEKYTSNASTPSGRKNKINQDLRLVIIAGLRMGRSVADPRVSYPKAPESSPRLQDFDLLWRRSNDHGHSSPFSPDTG